MNYFKNLIQQGTAHFGSGSYNTNEFNKFFTGFKKAFTKRLKRLNATDIQFSKGHFYLSGFFTVDEQAYYFILSDVRSNWGKPRLLVRTAKNYKDYTGGANNYVDIDNNIEYHIGLKFGIEVNENGKINQDKKLANEFVKNLKEKQRYEKKVSSAKKARLITWIVMEKLEIPNQSITVSKLGSSIVSCYCYVDNFSMYFDMGTKTLSMSLGKKTIDLDEISNKSRYQDCQQTLQLLKQNVLIFWSWGANRPTRLKDNILRLSVQGHHHTGYLYIVVNASDLFDVYLTDCTNEVVDKLEDLYSNMLVSAIDKRIERVPEYGA